MFRLFLLLVLLAGCMPAQVMFDRILHAHSEPQNWLIYSGNCSGHHYSSINQFNRSNARNLQLRWLYHPTYLANFYLLGRVTGQYLLGEPFIN